MKVADVMTRRVHRCLPTHTADTVMRTLWEQDLGALPVVDDAGRPIAMITDRDIAVATYTQGRPPSQIAVRSAMSAEVITAHVSDSLLSAERTMREHQLRRLPVVDESTRLVGVISLYDIARAQESKLGGFVQGSDVGQTFAAIARPRRPSQVAITPAELEDRPTIPFRAPLAHSYVSEVSHPAAPRALMRRGA